MGKGIANSDSSCESEDKDEKDLEECSTEMENGTANSDPSPEDESEVEEGSSDVDKGTAKSDCTSEDEKEDEKEFDVAPAGPVCHREGVRCGLDENNS